MNIETMTLTDFLAHPIDCNCGRVHTTDIRNVEISAGALEKLPTILKKQGYKNPFIIADYNTHAIAGQRISTLLNDKGILHTYHVLNETTLVPDERAIGNILMHFQQDCDVIIGVGAGTINDISRFISYRLHLPYFIAITAPSMDGYASTVAPLITDNLKTTYEAHMPQVIIADLDVISQAPMEMIAAGFGDILGKFTCLADWKLSAIINGEYYCETIAKMMDLSLKRTIALKDELASRNKEAMHELVEALILAGIAMSYAGNSRPASGSEHHLSHFWEMRMLFDGRPPVLHGAKVGIATVLVLKLYEYLRQESLTPEKIKFISSRNNDTATWEQEIKRVFREASAGVLKLEQQAGKNDPQKHNERLEAIARNWQVLEAVFQSLPTSQEVVDLLLSVQGPVTPLDIDIDQATLESTILYAKEIRNRYTVLQLLWDLNLMERYARQISAEVFGV